MPAPQWEAALALNFTSWQRLYRIVFPQAWVQMIPPLNSLLIQLLKGSALASFILLQDLTFHIGELRRVKQLEDENAKLKRLLAEAMLDNVVLKDLLGKG